MEDRTINFEILQDADDWMLKMKDGSGRVINRFNKADLFRVMEQTATEWNNHPDGCYGVTFTIA